MAGCGETVEGRVKRRGQKGRGERGGEIKIHYIKKKNLFIHILFYLLHMDTSAVVVIVELGEFSLWPV